MSANLTVRVLRPVCQRWAGVVPRSRAVGQRPAFRGVWCQGRMTSEGLHQALGSTPIQQTIRACSSATTSGVTSPPTNMGAITQASVVEDMLNITYEDGSKAKYPLPWLRDNCQCSECFHPPSIQRLFLIKNLKLDATIKEAKVIDQGVRLEWDDGHVSELTSGWLRDRSFSSECPGAIQPWLELPPKLWCRKDMQDKVPTDTLHNLLTNDEALYRWLCHLEQEGVFLITDAAREEGQLHKLAERVAFLRKTNYGETFTVKAKVDASNLAYTSASLGLHTDLPYYRYTPGMQMLHCIQQVETEGGENQLVDAFYIAEMMRKQHPDYFKLLSTVPVQFVDIGVDYYKYHKLFSVPVFNLDHSGEVVRVAYNNQVRDSFMPGTSPETVRDFYHAIKCFDDLMFSKDNHIELKMGDGDIICFHNYRVMHGRTGYRALGGGTRHLQGGYIDWDELQSRRRVLQLELNLTEKGSIFPE